MKELYIHNVVTPMLSVVHMYVSFQNAVTYDDVHVDFTWKEWTLLDPTQRNLYKDVMLDTYHSLTILGKTEWSIMVLNKETSVPWFFSGSSVI